MTTNGMLSSETLPPMAYDHDRVANAFSDLSARQKDNGADGGLLDTLEGNTKAKALLTGVFGNSPYLTRLTQRFPDFANQALTQEPDTVFDQILQEVAQGADTWDSQADIMQNLRQLKAKGALLIALADVADVWSVDQVTKAVTLLADACLTAALQWVLLQADAKGKFETADKQMPEKHSGITIIAMGKYGAFELNYSSDIDIIVFFDRDKVPVPEGADAQKFCIKVTRDIVKILQEPTGDGYVFRVDLRLRPDASATPVALSTDAAHAYYESLGQNWERAAMIKARAAVGDPDTGENFLKELRPFIWRRYLDYAAIEDIHSIKRQIHAHKGHGQIAIEGHNIKLGRGGIREIEFFVQTQQLIGGGRDIKLRDNTTHGAMDALVAAGIVEREVGDTLKESYRFLRRLEHRIQMVDDQQTHTLPETRQGVDQIGTFCGFNDPEDFRSTVRGHLERVKKYYAKLFEEQPSLGAERGSLVFTGVESDPDTLVTLSEMGFERPGDVSDIIRGWHHGRIRVTRSERSRALLTKLIPSLLEAISQTNNPDVAFVNFHHFIAGLPSGVQLFSMLSSHENLLQLLAEIFGMAPRLSSGLAKRSNVLDTLLDADFFAPMPGKDVLANELNVQLDGLELYEDLLDGTRIWAREVQFRVGVNLLQNIYTTNQAAEALSDIADVVIQGLLPVVTKDIIRQYGDISGNMVVIGMGKLGSREMSVTSDLDLIFVYDGDDEDEMSTGPKSLHRSQYFARLSQRLISALTAPTAEGELYEVDARLRPSGRSGPLAVHIDGFIKYQREEAWTWEKMALTRARVLAGAGMLQDRLTREIESILTVAGDADEIRKDASEMRARILKDKPTDNPWNVKYISGGLIDLEFITQVLQLIYGPEDPELLTQNTNAALSRLRDRNYIETALANAMLEAIGFYQSIIQLLRICVEGEFQPDEASESLKQLLYRSCSEIDFSRLETRLTETQKLVRDAFDLLISPK